MLGFKLIFGSSFPYIILFKFIDNASSYDINYSSIKFYINLY